MLSVDCWRCIIILLGETRKCDGDIKSLSRVCRNAWVATRENGYQYLRWKMNPNFVSKMNLYRFPWYPRIRSVTVCWDTMEFNWIRLGRPDITDMKVVFTKTEGEYKIENGEQVFYGIKRLHLVIENDKPDFQLTQLPDGIETFKIERSNCMTFDALTDGLTFVPTSYPDSLMQLFLHAHLSNVFDQFSVPRYLEILKIEGKDGVFPFAVTNINVNLKVLSTTSYSSAVCPHEFLDGCMFLNLRKLTLIDTYETQCECEFDLFSVFPNLDRVKTTNFYYDGNTNKRKILRHKRRQKTNLKVDGTVFYSDVTFVNK
jgi:hypothetical protein